jgi:hypothetical protein
MISITLGSNDSQKCPSQHRIGDLRFKNYLNAERHMQ